MLEGTCHCGQVSWRYDGELESATACNCTACRRYGVLWGYGYDGEDVHFSGETTAYVRGAELGFHFCPACGCVAYWRALKADGQGRRRVGFNLRLAEPDQVASLLIDHFDGLDTFSDLPRDGRRVADLWS